MPRRLVKLETQLGRLEEAVGGLGATSGQVLSLLARWRDECAATRFHLRDRDSRLPLLVGVFGGTGTGKSTIVNRLIGKNVSAASFRRTFTSGAVAIVESADAVPNDWIGIEHVVSDGAELPVRGKAGALIVAVVPSDLTSRATIVDTPDLDGDQPAHHAEADRVFRWVELALFLVTPEKYQMTELLPYYRLAQRYGIPSLFLMNKTENREAYEDYARQLESRRESHDDPELSANWADNESLFVVGRDGSAFEPPPARNLSSLRARLTDFRLTLDRASRSDVGSENRARDLLSRLIDQIIAPLRERRLIADRLSNALREIETPPAGIDVNPITQQLRQRLQQRSVLYLMGPQRILDRVRQAPGLLARLPRVAWDYMKTGEISAQALSPTQAAAAQQPPDFPSLLIDQFALLQSRIDDILRGSPAASIWLSDPVEGAAYGASKIDPNEAGNIAREEIGALRAWLEKRWDATPRDTRAVQALLKYLPGGKQLTQWTEAAPYLLTIALVTHHALFPHFDLVVFGGYSLATWLSEKISNEVSSRTRMANQRIADRFARLAHEQLERTRRWLDERVPSLKSIEALDQIVEQITGEWDAA